GIEERSKNGGAIPGITTGFSLLDKVTLGLQEGHLWVFAGLPGEGKSTIMQNVLEGAMATGAKTGVYQLEMPIEEQAFRFLCSDAMVDSQQLAQGMISNRDAMEVQKSVKRLSKLGAEFPVVDGIDADGLLA